MRPYFQLIAVGLLCCGCQGTGPAKYDNPVVGPPPPRLPAEQIQRKKLAAAEMREAQEARLASNPTQRSTDDLGEEGERPIKQASAKRASVRVGQTPDEEPVISSGIEQVRMPRGPNDPIPKFEDGTIVATVNGQPIFAGEIIAPSIGALAKKEEELKKALGPEYKPEVLDRVRLSLIAQSLPRIIERKMLVHAANTGLKKQQLEGLKKGIAAQWTEHLQEMMEQNEVGSMTELEELFKKSNFNIEEHKAMFEDERAARMFVSSKIHSKYEPSPKEMIAFYEEHKEEFKSVGKVRWQQLVVSFDVHKGSEGAKKQIDKVVQELLAGADFTETVKKYGDGPKAEKGGIWEWIERGTLKSKNVEQELFTLPIGDMSGVIETKDSYQIVQVLERTEDSYTPYEQLQEKIKAKMEQLVYMEKATALINEVRESTTVVTCFDQETASQKAAAREE